MARKGNPALIGAFVVGALVLAGAGLVVFGGGKVFRHTQVLVAYFDGSLKGMAVGAPVTFNGVKVGAVTDVRVVIDDKTNTITTPVYFEIDARRLRHASGAPIRFAKDAPELKQLTERGLRAQPELQSLITGQLQVSLNFHPGSPIRLTHLSSDYPEMPTVPSTMEKLSRTLESVPLDEIIADVRRTLTSVDTLINAPEVMDTLRGLNRTVGSTNRLVERVAAEVAPLMAKVDALSGDARSAMADARRVVTRLGPPAEDALKEYQKLAAGVNAQIGPLAEAVAKLAASADTALAQAQQTMKSVDAAIETDSPLRYDLARALNEVQLAARSLRGLTDYLERHPEAVVSGKRTESSR